MITMNKDDLAVGSVVFLRRLLVTTGLTTAAGVSEAGLFFPLR